MNASAAFECFTCCFDLFPSRDSISLQNLKFDGRVTGKGGTLHWRKAFVSWYPYVTLAWLFVILITTGALAIKFSLMGEPERYPGQMSVAEFTTVGEICIVGYVLSKVVVQIKYGPRDASEETYNEWYRDNDVPPLSARAQWFFHTLALPINSVALVVYGLHIGAGYRVIDVTFVRAVLQTLLMFLDLFVGHEPFLAMHLVWVFLTCVIYGLVMFGVYKGSYPVADIWAGAGLSIPIYGLWSLVNKFTEYAYKGEVFYNLIDPRQDRGVQATASAAVHPVDEDDEEDDVTNTPRFKSGPPV